MSLRRRDRLPINNNLLARVNYLARLCLSPSLSAPSPRKRRLLLFPRPGGVSPPLPLVGEEREREVGAKDRSGTIWGVSPKIAAGKDGERERNKVGQERLSHLFPSQDCRARPSVQGRLPRRRPSFSSAARRAAAFWRGGAEVSRGGPSASPPPRRASCAGVRRGEEPAGRPAEEAAKGVPWWGSRRDSQRPPARPA